jgi:hypothetical protein
MDLEILTQSSPAVAGLEEKFDLKSQNARFVRGFKYIDEGLGPYLWVVVEKDKGGFFERKKRELIEYEPSWMDAVSQDFPEDLLFGSFETADGVYDILKDKIERKYSGISQEEFKGLNIWSANLVKEAREGLRKWKISTEQSFFNKYTERNSSWGMFGIFFGCLLNPIVPEAYASTNLGMIEILYLPLLTSGAFILTGHKIQKGELLSPYWDEIHSNQRIANAINTYSTMNR